jgi:hypothetical protein
MAETYLSRYLDLPIHVEFCFINRDGVHRTDVKFALFECLLFGLAEVVKDEAICVIAP